MMTAFLHQHRVDQKPSRENPGIQRIIMCRQVNEYKLAAEWIPPKIEGIRTFVCVVTSIMASALESIMASVAIWNMQQGCPRSVANGVYGQFETLDEFLVEFALYVSPEWKLERTGESFPS